MNQGGYKQKDQLVSLYDRFSRIEDHLSLKKGSITLNNCWLLKSVLGRIAMKFQAEADGMEVPMSAEDKRAYQKFHLLKRPCKELEIDYDLLSHDYDAVMKFIK
jgi:hypothetical protein